ncbi:hypothetical protein [Streptomyces sp. NBC_01373]|uniref:hypothetical protein n=1 Tax=Streptomyces sp. NBC_01373 TaxID=2903843 RepID=UPI00225595B0|nr:hypothetical protein [Streptomyces sp. NBC_01373]MCX4699000.1 hypothetical protein [Streptomyces sp. NBC_01373]
MILFKQHSATGAAHLYEHLFGAAIDDFFYSHRLSPYVDYSFHARTLTGGIVYVDVRFHTEEAKALADQIKGITVRLDTQSITTTVTQVIAELEKAFKITWGVEEIQKELSEIEEKPWQDFADFDELDPKAITIDAGAFYTLKNAERLPSLNLRTNFTLDQDFADSHRELLPLFWQLARLMNANAKATLHVTTTAYTKNVAHTNTDKTTRLTHDYFIHRDIHLKASQVLDVACDAIRDLQQTDGIRRFVTNLREGSDSDPYRLAPNPVTVFDQSGILIGAKGWSRITTDENCKLILSHMKVSVSVGGKRASIDVRELLNL